MRIYNPFLALALLGIAGCNQGTPDENTSIEASPAKDEVLGITNLMDANGVSVGSAMLMRRAEGIVLDLELSGLGEGTHALHLHQVGACEGPGFDSAEGHLNPFGKSHGHLSSDGKHLGDLPNVEIPASGTLESSIEITASDADILPYVFDEDGTAIVLHQDADDYRTDPAGAAGPRIACGVIEEGA